MSFMLRHFLPNAIDVLSAGAPPLQSDLLAAEFRSNHRVSERKFIAELLPKGSIGAEIGVFTGLFSVSLLRYTHSMKIFFVDPWWKEFGSHYPDWGVYTNYGGLGTQAAYNMAMRRIARNASSTATEVLVQHSADFLTMLDSGVLDWVYLDSTHSYEGTRTELRLLFEKLKPNGIVAGDDWHDADHPHAGVKRAVLESIARGEFNMLGSVSALQWVVRKAG